MTVRELKEELDHFPEDAVVYVPCEKYVGIPHAICEVDTVSDDLPTETDRPNPRIIIY